MDEFGDTFPHLCENFLSNIFMESVTLHMGRTGFPVSILKQTLPKLTPKFSSQLLSQWPRA